MTRDASGDPTAGGAIFRRLKALGVAHVFVNSGTDFPPIIEGLAEAAAAGIDLPTPVVVPHEHAALGMAHGFYFATGRAQADAVCPDPQAVVQPIEGRQQARRLAVRRLGGWHHLWPRLR